MSPHHQNLRIDIIYAGINGYLDDIPVESIKDFISDLRLDLTTVKMKYGEIVRDTKKIDDEAEGFLKESINNVKQKYLS